MEWFGTIWVRYTIQTALRTSLERQLPVDLAKGLMSLLSTPLRTWRY